jgi:hypothetical protein
VAAPASFSIYRGEDKTIPLQFLSPPQDTTGRKVEFRAVGLVDGTTIVKDNGSVGGLVGVNEARSLYSLSFTNADTAAVKPQAFLFTTRVTDFPNAVSVSGSFYLLPTP